MRTPLRLAIASLSAASLVSPTAQAADLAPLQIVDDPAGDHPTVVRAEVGADWMGDDVTPIGAASDLVGVHIAETDTTIDLTWEAFDINELVYPERPLNITYYFEFALGIPNGPSAQFSLRTRLSPSLVSTSNPTGGVNMTYPVGSLASNCTTSGTVVSCTTVPGSSVTVTVDTATERVTASMRRQDLKGSDGVDLAVDGAQLVEADLFRGIAACGNTFTHTWAALCDQADLDLGIYTFGQERPSA